MKTIIIIVVIALLFLSGGCSSITYENSGTKITYTRWFYQKIDECTLMLPDGSAIKFKGQKSDVELALEYAGAKAKVGE